MEQSGEVDYLSVSCSHGHAVACLFPFFLTGARSL
jgi:hypothetical protein